jgi:hypothetical protein
MPAETHPLWNNVRLLHQAKRRVDLHEAILRQAQALRTADITLARDALKVSGLSVDELPVLMVLGVLSADLLTSRIRGDMPVALAFGDLDHLRLIPRLSR